MTHMVEPFSVYYACQDSYKVLKVSLYLSSIRFDTINALTNLIITCINKF